MNGTPLHIVLHRAHVDGNGFLANRPGVRIFEDMAHKLPPAFQGQDIGCLMCEFQPNQRTLENHPLAFALLREVAQQARVDDPTHRLQRALRSRTPLHRPTAIAVRILSPSPSLRRKTYAALMKNSSRIRRNRIEQWRISRRRRSQQSETGCVSNLNAIFINQEGKFEARSVSKK